MATSSTTRPSAQTDRDNLVVQCSGNLLLGRIRIDLNRGELISRRGLHDAHSSYLLSSYRIATAPELNSSRLTSFKSTCFDSPANNVGPCPASLGCTTNSYSSINPSSANAIGSLTPPVNSPLPDSRLSC